MKRILRELVIRIILIINLLGGMYILMIVGSLEHFIEVTFTQWVIFFAIIIFYIIEILIVREV